MRIMGKAATAVVLLALVARTGGAQSLPGIPAAVTHHAPSIETMYKQMGLVAHAAKGQTVDQQKIDAKECYETAKSQTGFDPLAATKLSPTTAAAAAGSHQQVGPFKKAAGSCLKSRGYTLK